MAARAEAARQPSGFASPRAPRPASAAAGSRAGGVPASSYRYPAGRRGAGCARPPPRARAHAAPAPDPGRRRDRAAHRAPAARPARRRARAATRPEGRRPPRRDGAAAPARSLRAQLPALKRPHRTTETTPAPSLPPPRPRRLRRAGHDRRARARRPPHDRGGSPPSPAARPRAPQARSADRILSPPCGAPPERD